MRQFILATLIAVSSISTAFAVTSTVSFQNGKNGYTGTYDRLITDLTQNVVDLNGADVAQYFVDGYAANSSADSQGFLRFDNIIGNGPGQIPAGATILSARLEVNTSTVGNAQSPGPWGIGQLLQAFDGSTTYFGSFNCGGCALVSRGAWWQDGYTERPLAAFGNRWQGDPASADVREIVQNWASGAANHGFVIHTGNPAGTTDGWSIIATGHPLIDKRPQLAVTYTTDAVEVSTFQRGLNDYMGDTMAYVKSGTNIYGTTVPLEPDAGKDDITHDGATGVFTVAGNTTIAAPAPLVDFQQFLDGPQFNDTSGVAASVDDFALIRFGNVFGSGPNQAPSDVPVAKAWLSLTTGDASTNAQSNGEWSVHPVLRNWDTTSLHSSFGTVPGLQVSDGDIAPALDSRFGIIYGSEVWFDVSSYLEGVRTGATDNGLAILSTSTADGWQIHLNGSSQAEFRPKLVVASGNPAIVVPGLAGDYNDNGVVDAADYVVWRKAQGSEIELTNDPLGGTIGQGQYDQWRANFGKIGNLGGPLGSGAAVPEPANWLIAMFVSVLGATTARRRK